MRGSPAKRSRRRGWGIHAYVGGNGFGKSAAMVWDTIPSLEAGRRVLSTVRLLDYRNPRPCDGCDDPGHLRPLYGPPPRDEVGALTYETPEVVGWVPHRQAHPGWDPFTDWDQLLDGTRYRDVLLDEVAGVASSRESSGLPAAVALQLQQMRREDLVIRWSAPAWARADKIIREASQAVTFCFGYLPTTEKDDQGQSRSWRRRRVVRWRTYDRADFDEFTEGKRQQLKTLCKEYVWLPGHPVFAAYDSFDRVSSVGTVSDAGTCYSCGGSRRRPECSCHDYRARRRRGASGADAGPPERGAEAPQLAPVPSLIRPALPVVVGSG